MSDESADPVVQEEVKQEVSLQAEETTPAPDQVAAPVEGAEQVKPHPLEPDGDRFKQVWARAKAAEAEREQLKAEIQREREERIRYEERLKAQEEAKAKAEPEYTWEQLEGFISEGKITRAQANEYRERKIEERAVKKAEERLRNELASTSQVATVSTDIERYKKAIPEILQAGSPERQKVEREYAYMVNVLKFPKTLETELAATRAALGDVETVERTVTAKRTATKEPFMETHSSTHKPQNKTTDPTKNLNETQRRYYEKQIEKGRYRDWNEVKAELEFKAPDLRYQRG
jgi:hypothetical protein